MSVLQPPPKRQKVYYGVSELEQPTKKSAPNVVVQFITDEDGQSLAPAVNLPADLERDALESLVNKLSKSVNITSVVDWSLFMALRRMMTLFLLLFTSIFLAEITLRSLTQDQHG
jgi:hypothetical protein